MAGPGDVGQRRDLAERRIRRLSLPVPMDRDLAGSRDPDERVGQQSLRRVENGLGSGLPARRDRGEGIRARGKSVARCR